MYLYTIYKLNDIAIVHVLEKHVDIHPNKDDMYMAYLVHQQQHSPLVLINNLFDWFLKELHNQESVDVYKIIKLISQIRNKKQILGGLQDQLQLIFRWSYQCWDGTMNQPNIWFEHDGLQDHLLSM